MIQENVWFASVFCTKKSSQSFASNQYFIVNHGSLLNLYVVSSGFAACASLDGRYPYIWKFLMFFFFDVYLWKYSLFHDVLSSVNVRQCWWWSSSSSFFLLVWVKDRSQDHCPSRPLSMRLHCNHQSLGLCLWLIVSVLISPYECT